MIVVVDFGGQTCHLINRRVRELGVDSKIVAYKTKAAELQLIKDLKGIILSGGPSFVNLKDSPSIDRQVFSLGVPVLGICYGMQLMGYLLDGKVGQGKTKEFGGVTARLKPCLLFKNVSGKQLVWMSHGDQVTQLPRGFKNFGSSRYIQNIAMADEKNKLYAIQFHPEVGHTPKGMKILKNFVVNICRAKKTWSDKTFIEKTVEKIRQQAGKERVICGLSGGVDSSTSAALVYKAVGKQLRCVYVNNGLMRLNESEQVETDFKKFFGKSLVIVKAEKQFLKALAGVTDPERKRKIIGELFIRIFEKEAQKWKAKFLVQGTIYPDVIESARLSDVAATIKSHHNVGGLPKRMALKLIEPLRDLYKDEVRQLAEKLKLPNSIVWRQVFPGPGLAVRIRGEVTKERLERLRLADAILREEVGKIMQEKDTWMTFAIYVPLRTTGVKGDGRSFEEMIAIRSITSKDAMTADWTRLPDKLLAKVSSRIVNEVAGINRVVYDITTKPPATMEWE